MSHRSIMLASLAEGATNISGFLEGEDSLATCRAFRQMGANIEPRGPGRLRVTGVGMRGLKQPVGAIDLGNSGTAMRLMMGILAGQSFDTTLTGDDSLRSRPMGRVIKPLMAMGAGIQSNAEKAPLKIRGGASLQGMHYPMPIASAQVKSAILLAGLFADGETCVVEPAPTRDHTERMLRGFGYEVNTQGDTVCLRGGGELIGTQIDVPGDISSAAFFLVGGLIAPDSDLTLEHVGVNPTRTGVIDILRSMGGQIELFNQREIGGEPVADIRVLSSRLTGINVPQTLVPLAIDEFPAIAVAAACAQGVTEISGAEELRVKESDRISAIVSGLCAIGIDAQEKPDGLVINGGSIGGGTVDSLGDHRIAMAFSMAALRAKSPITIADCDNVATSFPGYELLAASAGLRFA